MQHRRIGWWTMIIPGRGSQLWATVASFHVYGYLGASGGFIRLPNLNCSLNENCKYSLNMPRHFPNLRMHQPTVSIFVSFTVYRKL